MAIIPCIRNVEARSTQVTVYGLFELDIDLAVEYTNPYDLQQVDLSAQFQSPSGKVCRVIGFYAPCLGGDESRPDWHVRFTPNEPGNWNYQVILQTAAKIGSCYGTLRVIEDSTERGFLRISSDGEVNPHFVYEDGTPYFAVGENLAWYNDSFADYDAWLPPLAEAGVNFIRLWMASWSFALEWNDTGLGDYRKRQVQADQLDYLFAECERLGIVIMLCLQNHGQYAATINPQWSENPYNKALGGPLNSAEEFFTHSTPKNLTKQLYRYIVARYGHYTNLLTWELFNEVDQTENYDSSVVASWHQEMSEYIRSIDPYQHLITTSFSNPFKDSEVFSVPEMDFTNTHFYHVPDMVEAVMRCDQDRLNEFGKATFCAEFGPDTEGPTLSDELGVNIHNGLWAGVFSGATGTPMTWWWDTYIHPYNLYPRFSSLTQFLGPADWLKWQLFSPQVSPTQLRAFGRRTKNEVMLWIQDPNHFWRNVVSGYEAPTFSDTTVQLDLPAGTYEVAFWDSWQGTWMEKRQATVEGKSLLLAIPAWQRDIALRISPEPR